MRCSSRSAITPAPGRATVAGPAIQVVQKIVEIHRFSTNGEDGPEDRGDSTNADPGQGCRHPRCGAAPGVHVSGGTENSWS